MKAAKGRGVAWIQRMHLLYTPSSTEDPPKTYPRPPTDQRPPTAHSAYLVLLGPKSLPTPSPSQLQVPPSPKSPPLEKKIKKK
jgi:hypothetical protein